MEKKGVLLSAAPFDAYTAISGKHGSITLDNAYQINAALFSFPGNTQRT